MGYKLAKLLAVREHRENRALSRLSQCRKELNRAEALKSEKERKLSEYRRLRQAEELRLLDDLKSKPAALLDLLRYVDAVESLSETQAGKAKQVDDAARQLVQAAEELTKARQQVAEAYRKKVKIEEHRNIWMARRKRCTEQAAETEIEDLAGAAFFK